MKSSTRGAELLASFERLTRAFGIDAGDLPGAIAAGAGWGDRSCNAPLLPCGFRPGIPWGLSVVVGARAPEVRLLVEAQADPPSPTTYGRAAEQLTMLFAQRTSSMDPLRPVLAKIAPGAQPYVRVWHAAAFASAPTFRVYLCVPAAHRSLSATRRFLLDDLGLGSAADVLAPALPERAAITIVSLDLAAASRTKIYALIPDASFAELEVLCALGEESRPDDVARFARAMLGEERRIWWLVCFVFVGGKLRRVALHLGVPRHIPEDADVGPRLRALFDDLGIDPAPYLRSVEALGPARARHHFVSFQRIGDDPRVTVYFLPEGAERV